MKLAALMCLLLSAAPAAAQLADVPDDQELFASYCLGVAQGGGTDGTRFSEYLKARGYGLGGARSPDANRSIVRTGARGRRAGAACAAHTEQCAAKSSGPVAVRMARITACQQDSSACQAASRCGAEDRLPF